MVVLNNHTVFFELNKLNKVQKVSFCLICCERLIPGYQKFNQIINKKEGLLEEVMIYLWNNFANDTVDNQKLYDYLKQIDISTPDTGDYDTRFVSYALNAYVSVFYTIKYFLDGLNDHIFYIIELSTDNVYLSLDEDLTDENPLMQDEFQKLLTYVEDISNNEILKGYIEELRSKFKGISNIVL